MVLSNTIQKPTAANSYTDYKQLWEKALKLCQQSKQAIQTWICLEANRSAQGRDHHIAH